MPKLRNASTDTGRLTQWIGRKFRNHHPLEELKLEPNARAKKASTYKRSGEAEILTQPDDENRVFYRSAGRTFAVTVEEITDAEEAELLVQGAKAVGY